MKNYLSFLALASVCSLLHAQASDPGRAERERRMNQIAGGTAPVAAQGVLVGQNLFPEGTFEIFGESKLNPLGWTFPDRNDKPFQNGFRAEAVPSEAGGRELRIVHPSPNQTTMVQMKLPLPAGIDRLRLGYRILAKQITLGETDPAGNGAGVYFRIYDSANQPIRGSAGWLGGGTVRATDSEWNEREQIVVVPEDGKMLECHVLFRSAAGEVRVDDFEVVVVGTR